MTQYYAISKIYNPSKLWTNIVSSHNSLDYVYTIFGGYACKP